MRPSMASMSSGPRRSVFWILIASRASRFVVVGDARAPRRSGPLRSPSRCGALSLARRMARSSVPARRVDGASRRRSASRRRFAAGVALGAEADALTWPLPVHPPRPPVVIEGRVLDTTAIDAEPPSLVLEARRVRGREPRRPRAARGSRCASETTHCRRGGCCRGSGSSCAAMFRPPEDARNPGSTRRGAARAPRSRRHGHDRPALDRCAGGSARARRRPGCDPPRIGWRVPSPRP